MRKYLLAALLATAALGTSAAGAQAATVRVDSEGDGGWLFNRDPANTTPFQFTTAEQSIGSGSLEVLPITNTPPADKFTADLNLGIPAADLSSVSYDFRVADGVANPTAFKQFYLNIYVIAGPNPHSFYNCRYDYVPTGATPGQFNTVTVNQSTVTTFGDRAGDGFTCPTSLGGLPAGSLVRAIVLNVGDGGNGSADLGVGGFYDNVVVTTPSDSTTYDFEASPASKDECKKGGYAAFGFENQGQCVSFFNHQ